MVELSAADQSWLSELFAWSTTWPVGQGFVQALRGAVTAALSGDVAESDRLNQSAAQVYLYLGDQRLFPYVSWLLDEAREILDSRSLPAFAIRPAHELAGEMLFLPRPGAQEPLWPAIELDPVHERWLREDVFEWLAPFPMGEAWTAGLVEGVLEAFAGRPWQASKQLAAARWGRQYLPAFSNEYSAELLSIAEDLARSRELPAELSRLAHEQSSDRVTLERPILVAPEDARAFLRLFDSLGDAETWLATRQGAILATREQLEGIELSKAPELASEALRQHEELADLEAAWEIERRELEAERDQAMARRDRARAAQSGELAGISSAWKKVKKQLKRSWDDALDPALDLRDWLSHNLLPEDARRLGKKIEAETKRFGRRIDAELQRGVEQIALNAQFLYAAAPLLGLIPAVGWVFVLLGSAIVATAEITYALEQKKALSQAIREARRALQAEIEALMAEALELEERARAMELERQMTLQQALQESVDRVAAARRREEEAADRRRSLVLGTGATLGGVVLARRGSPWIGGVLLAGGLWLAVQGISWEQA
ncbi:MAG: hypothetical protein AB7G54_00520 [Methyloceanibacter sp.]